VYAVIEPEMSTIRTIRRCRWLFLRNLNSAASPVDRSARGPSRSPADLPRECETELSQQGRCVREFVLAHLGEVLGAQELEPAGAVGTGLDLAALLRAVAVTVGLGLPGVLDRHRLDGQGPSAREVLEEELVVAGNLRGAIDERQAPGPIGALVSEQCRGTQEALG
jgi:hypothetical protein